MISPENAEEYAAKLSEARDMIVTARNHIFDIDADLYKVSYLPGLTPREGRKLVLIAEDLARESALLHDRLKFLAGEG